jgi:hypothetical protein
MSVNWNKWKKIAIIVLGVLIVFIVGGLIAWTSGTLGPSDQALSMLQSSGEVRIIQESDLIVFAPMSGQPSFGFILYPGGGVDFRSYSPLLHGLAERNVLVAVVQAPLDLAFFNANGADEVIAAYPRITYWVIGGHSLGGVVAASYAAGRPDVSGLVLLASYPADDSLMESGLRVLSIYGSNDRISTPEEVLQSMELLPEDTLFFEIEGGNHSQFGSYGLQPGDGDATISPEEQWAQIFENMTEFFDSNAN